MNITVRRVYDRPVREDGIRVLVDRLWPRGLSKASAEIDVWMKALAPSSALRQWYRHDIQKWPEFKAKYVAELDANPEALGNLIELATRNPVVLLYGAREARCNNASVLKEYLEARLSGAWPAAGRLS